MAEVQANQPVKKKMKIQRQSSRSVHDLLALVENTPTVPLIDQKTADDMDLKSPSLLLRSKKSLVSTKNVLLNTMEQDFLYHLGLTKLDAQNFKGIKYVCIGGTNDRMSNFAKTVGDKFGFPVKSIGIHKRYVLYHIGPCLVCSHGMGGPSISILLNEIAKLLKYAGADSLWIRMGTSGGVGVNPGTVCISKQAVNGALEPYHETIVLGKRVQRPAVFDQGVADELVKICEELKIESTIGKTMCCDDFYEGQGRLDGAICEYTKQDKMDFLERASKEGVRNVEMESLQFGAFCNKINVRSIVVCVALLNRLEGDQVTSTMEQLKQFEERPVDLIIEFIKRDFQAKIKEEKGEDASDSLSSGDDF